MMRIDQFLQQGRAADWIVENFVPADQKGLVVARPGGGKSWLLESLAIAVASGSDFLGRFRVKQGPVLIVDQDSPTEVLRERLQALMSMFVSSPSDLFVESQQGYAIDQKTSVGSLSEIIEDKRPTLLIFETLDTITSGNFDENRAKDIRRLFRNLDDLQARNPCAILISHHLGKKGQVGEPVTWIRGSSALPARVDVAYGLQRLRSMGNSNFLVQSFPKRVKTVSGFQVQLITTTEGDRLETASLGWVRDLDGDLDATLAENRAHILGVVADRTWEGITAAEALAAREGYLTQREVRAIFELLLNEELVVRGKEAHGRFRFWLPGYAPEPAPTDALQKEPSGGGQWKAL